MSWLLPLVVTVTFYGLAGGVWKQATLDVWQFCLLFVAAKTVVNLGWWGLGGRRSFLDSGRFVLWALLGQVINGLAWICYFEALNRGPAAIVQTITAAYTALAALLALVVLRERVIALQVVGIAIVVVASGVLGFTTTSGGQDTGAAWKVFSFATLLLWAVAVTIFKHAYRQPGADDHRFFVLNWLGCVLTLLPYGWLTAGAKPFTGLALGMLVVSLYALGDLALFAAIARGPASIVSPVSGLYPLPTLIYVALVLKMPITPLQLGAIFAVLVAMMMVLPPEENPVLRLLSAGPNEQGGGPPSDQNRGES